MATTVRLSQLYSILIEKRGKDEADAIVNYVEEKIDSDIADKIEIISAKIDKSNAELKEYVERSLKQQLWSMIALIVPLYLALLGFFLAIYNILRK